MMMDAGKREEPGFDKPEAVFHRDLAALVCNLRFDAAVPVVAEANTLCIASAEAYFARRLDCRTYFAQRQRYGHDQPEGVFHGQDEEQLAFGRELCKRLGLAPDEVGRVDVLREFAQAARVDPETNQVLETAPRRELRSLVHIERVNAGVPVWSSHLAFGLTAKREIGLLEFHWPDIPEAIVREARRMAEMVRAGWRAPEQTVAAVESIQAGIVHTPAIGYFFDAHAAIRVVYRSLDARVGRKPMYHFDRHGVPVKLRSASELIREKPLPKRRALAEKGCDCAD